MPVETILTNKNYRMQADKVKQTLREAGGKAADEIIHYIDL